MTQSIEVSAARMERVALAVYAGRRVVACCVMANEAFGNVTGNELDDETTWSEVAVVTASFAKSGRNMLQNHPKKYAETLRQIARVMLEGANRIDPEGAPS